MPFSLGNMFASVPGMMQGYSAMGDLQQQEQSRPYQLQALKDKQQADQQTLELNRMKLQEYADTSEKAKQEQNRFGELMKDDSFVGPDGKPMSQEVKALASARQAAIDAKDPDKVLAIDAAVGNAEYKAAIGAKMKAEALQTRTEQGIQDANAILQADGDPAVVEDVLKNAVEQGRVPPEKAAELRGLVKLGLDGKMTPQSKALLTSRVAAATKIVDQMKTQKEAADRVLREREVAAKEKDAKTREQREIREAAKAKEGKAGVKEGTLERTYNEQLQNAAGDVVSSLEAIMDMPSGASTGTFQGRNTKDLLSAPLGVLTNTFAAPSTQAYITQMQPIAYSVATVLAGGRPPRESQINSVMDKLTVKEGDTLFTKIRKLSLIRQDVDNAINSKLLSPVIGDDRKALLKDMQDKIHELVPFTAKDVTEKEFKKDSTKTINDVIKEKMGAGGERTPGKFDPSKLSPTQQEALPQIKKLIASGDIDAAKAIAKDAGITLK